MFATTTTLPQGVSSAGSLLWEAVSVLNGAHLSPSGRLGNLVRKYHHAVSAAASSTDSEATATLRNTRTSARQPSPSLPSLVLSELGISDETWTRAASTFHHHGNPTGSLFAPPTVSDVLRESKLSLKGHAWQGRRQFSQLSSLARSISSGRWRQRGWALQPNLQLSPSHRMFSIAQLEDRANSETDNAKAQARYLEAVVDDDPQYVVRRFESGRYAVDSEVRRIYQRALEMMEKLNLEEQRRMQSPFGGVPQQTSDVNLGSRDNPMHVVNHPRKGGFFREMWSLARFIIIAFIITTFVSSALVTQMKTGSHQMTKEFRPDPSDKRYTFDDVQGITEAKEEVRETVEFLKNPERFQRLGAKLPTGLLLIGPPGTGKTLLAKAVAGEAEVPFFFASGSEFDEMFVGVGAARVRKLFEQARRHRPCVVFIDELDAVGGARVASSVHPYSRMTLNQLLVEMDGYNELEGIVVIGATNFPESLDKALIRPGRFDSRINIPLPDVKARYEILSVHAKKIKMSEDVDLEVVARGTSGFSGADLANLINQAALRGSAEGKEAVTPEHLDHARDKILMGPERKSAVIEEKNRRLVAYHEGGHAIVALFTPEALPIHKATIMPRGEALGMVSQLSEKDELSWSKKQLMARMDVAMGGRVAEEMVFGSEHITSGASSDLEAATRIAKMMVTKLGMTESVGPVSHSSDDKTSPATQRLIDEEVKRLLKEAYERAHHILKTHSLEHKRLAEALLKYETLSLEEIKLVIAAKPLRRKL